MIRYWLKKNFYFLLRNSWVLMYHHIDEKKNDPWNLCVTPARFEAQLKWFRLNCQIQSLDDLINDWKANRLKKHSIALTFDDGYMDNFGHAVPLLEKYEIPATFFITTDPVIKRTYFWWDVLQALILEKDQLPENFTMKLNDKLVHADLCNEKILSLALTEEISKWRFPQPPENRRLKLFFELWQELRTMEAAEQNSILHKIQSWADAENLMLPKLMDEEQIKNLSANPLFTIGGHTVSHPALGSISEQIQEDEISNGKKQLEMITGKTVDFIAYPYGIFNEATKSISEKQGYKAGFTTYTTPLQKCRDAFSLGRMMVDQNMDFRRLIR